MNDERRAGVTAIAVISAMYAAWNLASLAWVTTTSGESLLFVKSIPGLILATLSAICAVGCWLTKPWAPRAFGALMTTLVIGGWLSLAFFDSAERYESVGPIAVATSVIAILGLLGFRYLRAATRSAA